VASKKGHSVDRAEEVEDLPTEILNVDNATSKISNAEKSDVESVDESALVSTITANSVEEASTSSSSKGDVVSNSKNIANLETERRDQLQSSSSSQAPTISSKFSLVTDYSSSSNDSD
jgi:hypothetical protein